MRSRSSSRPFRSVKEVAPEAIPPEPVAVQRSVCLVLLLLLPLLMLLLLLPRHLLLPLLLLKPWHPMLWPVLLQRNAEESGLPATRRCADVDAAEATAALPLVVVSDTVLASAIAPSCRAPKRNDCGVEL